MNHWSADVNRSLWTKPGQLYCSVTNLGQAPVFIAGFVFSSDRFNVCHLSLARTEEKQAMFLFPQEVVRLYFYFIFVKSF